ncbi:hypothetical protein niasHT_002738 [Heterodera trifolii]|uniref:Uncharacterized protein n=1 Tax=Heterodera trifolii TaxID=157864 RepID=A0ABD2MA55_9BILA
MSPSVRPKAPGGGQTDQRAIIHQFNTTTFNMDAEAEKRRIMANCKRTIASMRYIICQQMKNPVEAKNLLSRVSEYLQQHHNFGPTAPLDVSLPNYLNENVIVAARLIAQVAANPATTVEQMRNIGIYEHLSKTGRMITQFAADPATTVDDMRSFGAYLSTYTNQLEGRNSHLL